MTPEEMREKAMELFRQRYHWSQAILAVGLEKMGMENPDMIRSVGSYGGGIASTGRVCGILLGAVAAVSARYSKSRPEEQDDPNMWRLSYKLTKIFETLCEPYGGIDCKDIARVDWRNHDQVQVFYGNPDGRRKICTDLTGELAKHLGEILEKAGAAKKD